MLYWRDGTTLPYVGYADAVVAIDEREHGILDFKTSSSEKQLLDLELDNALSAYAFGHELATGIRTRQTMYGVYVRKKEPTTTLLSSRRDETDLVRLHSIAKITTAQIRAGLYLPADTALQCGGCAFRAACQRLFGGPKPGGTHA